MVSQKIVDEFLSQKEIAIVGVSSNKKKFGTIVYNDLKSKGYNVYAVNPQLQSIDGDKVYSSVSELAEKVKAIVTIIPPEQTLKILPEAEEKGITHFWFQQGSSDERVEDYCDEYKLKYVADECILMFTQPSAFIHKAHKWINGVLGKLPA